MRSKELIKRFNYITNKQTIKTVFTRGETLEEPGYKILQEYRKLGYKISTSVFYKIRKELLQEYKKGDVRNRGIKRFGLENLSDK